MSESPSGASLLCDAEEIGWDREKTKIMAHGKDLEWQGVDRKTQVGELAVGPVVFRQQLLAAGATHTPGAQVWTWLRSSPAPWP